MGMTAPVKSLPNTRLVDRGSHAHIRRRSAPLSRSLGRRGNPCTRDGPRSRNHWHYGELHGAPLLLMICCREVALPVNQASIGERLDR